jgi:hypothetical protein
VILGNGDIYNVPGVIAGGAGSPATQFFGITSATTFTSATFKVHSGYSFGLSDFRFGASIVPEPRTVGLIGPAVLALLVALRLGAHRR